MIDFLCFSLSSARDMNSSFKFATTISDEKIDLPWICCEEFFFVSLTPAVNSKKEEGNLDIFWGTGEL